MAIFGWAHRRRLALLLILCLSPTVWAKQSSSDDVVKIAVIGGGVSGTFVTNYLTRYNVDCRLRVTLFEPYPFYEKHLISQQESIQQGSRVQSLQLDDGSIVELGASIAYKEFHLVREMIAGDESLETGPPMATSTQLNESELRKGMGIYNGNGEWKLLLGTADTPSTPWDSRWMPTKFVLLWRYGWDLVKLSRICREFLDSFAQLPGMLANTDEYFFESPDEIWKTIGLDKAVTVSFDEFLDAAGISNDAWWKRWLHWLLPTWFERSSLREELLTAVNLVNYNQDNAGANGIVGMGSFAGAMGGLFSIVGGNTQLLKSALRQATQQLRDYNCSADRIETITTRVDTVVWNTERFQLYSKADGESIEELGDFDIVILAAPLQFAKMDFLIQSGMDAAVLQPMPLGGLVQPEEADLQEEGFEGHQVLPKTLPPSAERSYTQVVTTLVSNASLSPTLFAVPESSAMPRSIVMTSPGKRLTSNVTAITQLKNNTYKIFSNERLSSKSLSQLFGPSHTVEYVKMWGGPIGGATPDYRGEGVAAEFLLYDGTTGLDGHMTAGALFYPVALEQSSLACMEIAAIGARAVAKLLQRRLGLLHPHPRDDVRDEL